MKVGVYISTINRIIYGRNLERHPKYEGKYQVSNLGNVKSLERRVRTGKGYRTLKESVLKSFLLRDGYLYIGLSNPFRQYAVHQLVAICFLGHKRQKFKVVVDHINNVKTDNRVENLQLLNNRENSTKDTFNKTGYLGVTKQCNKFKATIRDNGVSVYLGMFKTAELAHEGYLQRRKEIEGRCLHK